jgi:hypothetical protein
MFKTRSYYVFDYKPRTYDPVLEERREKLRRYRQEQGKTMGDFESVDYVPGSLIRGNMYPKMANKARKRSPQLVRTVVIAVFLFFLAYVILRMDLASVVSFFINR